MNNAVCEKIKIFDTELQYYEKGEGETVVIFHGNGTTSKSLKKLFLELSKSYHVIGIDTRGHGNSEIGKKVLSIELFADDFIEFFKLKNLKKPSIIGFSDGANIGMMMCKKYSEKINKVILISGNYKEAGLKKWGIAFIKVYIVTLKILSIFNKEFKWKTKVANIMLKDIGMEREDLNKIKNSALVLCAKNDIIKLRHSKDISKAIKKSKFKEIKKSNHMNVMNKDKTIKEIISFLREEIN